MVQRRFPALSLTLSAVAVLGPAGLGRVPLAWAAEPRPLKPPNVVMGPAEVEAAPHVDAPISEVTVFSDRARVRRRGRLSLKPGAAVVRLPDLPGATFLDTIHVGATGARVVRVETKPVEHDRLEIGQAVKLLDALDAANDRASELADRSALEQWEIGLLTRLAPEPQLSEEKRQGRKGVGLDLASWWKALDFVTARLRAAEARQAALEADRRRLDAERDALRADIARIDQGGFSQHAVEVVAVIETAGGAAAEVELEYFVPAASWKPSYDLHFSTVRGQARLETAAVVQQATGEDWPEARLSFSTAMPGRGIELPELLTWTLGERSEFVPRPRARTSPPVEPQYPVPTEPVADERRALEAEMVRARLAQARNAPSPLSEMVRNTGAMKDLDQLKQEVADDMAVAGLEGEPVGGLRHRALAGKSVPQPAAPAPPPAPRPQAMMLHKKAAVQKMAEAEAGVGGDESEGSWQDIVAVPRRAQVETVGVLADAPAIRKRAGAPPPIRVPLALYDTPPASEAPRLIDPYLPAVSAGGFAFVYRAPTPVAVPSTGKEIRIPLASATFGTTAYYEAMPALAPTAFLHARVRNDGTRPLLRGPVAIFGDGELVGVGEIQTTGPSGDIELPLGADQDVRLVRQVVPSTRTSGLMFKTDETTYEVKIQIGNYKKQPVTVELTDQVPRSRSDKVEVKLLGADAKPLGDIDLDGTIRFKVDVAAGATRTVTLRYQITRPHDWELYQR
jgi:hypothetical protein